MELRRSLGFKLLDTKVGLLKFASFLQQRRASRITVQLAMEWAQRDKTMRPAEWAKRLSFVRGFLSRVEREWLPEGAARVAAASGALDPGHLPPNRYGVVARPFSRRAVTWHCPFQRNGLCPFQRNGLARWADWPNVGTARRSAGRRG